MAKKGFTVFLLFGNSSFYWHAQELCYLMWQQPWSQADATLTTVRKPAQCPLKASDMKISCCWPWRKTNPPYQDRVQLDISESQRWGRCTAGLRWPVGGCCTTWAVLGSPVHRCCCRDPTPPSWSSPRWLLGRNRWRTLRVEGFKNYHHSAETAEKPGSQNAEEWSCFQIYILLFAACVVVVE